MQRALQKSCDTMWYSGDISKERTPFVRLLHCEKLGRKGSDRFLELRIHKDTEKGDNDTVKIPSEKGGVVKMGSA